MQDASAGEAPLRAFGAGGTYLWIVLLVLGCSSYDAGLLERAHQGDTPAPAPGLDAGPPNTDAGRPGACTPTAEQCNDQDDDCDGKTDEQAGATCTFDHARGACASGGTCVLVECDADYFDCDGTKQDGCETPSTEVACGECGRVCSDAGATRDDDAGCVPEVGGEVCDERDNDCDDNVDEGLLNSTDHCGACGVACARDNAITSCQSGSCELVGCMNGFADCNQDPDDGCEPEPCTPEQMCLAAAPSARGASCDACVCQSQTCVTEAQNCASTAQCLALVACYAANPCQDCGGTTTASCTDCYDLGNGPCAAELNLAAGGADGADPSGVNAGNCSSSDPLQPCAAAVAFASCRNGNCASECP